MEVRRDGGVRVDNEPVPVKMLRTSRSLLCGTVDRAEPEGNQHRRNGKLERVRHPWRQFGTHDDERSANNEQGQGMAYAPPGAEQGGADATALTADERRHRGEVVGLEGMAHAEQRSESGAGQQLKQRHLRLRSILYVIAAFRL